MKAMTENGERKTRRKERTEKKGLRITSVQMMMMIQLPQKKRKGKNILKHPALPLGMIVIT